MGEQSGDFAGAMSGIVDNNGLQMITEYDVETKKNLSLGYGSTSTILHFEMSGEHYVAE